MSISSPKAPLLTPQIPQHPDFRLINVESAVDFGWVYCMEYEQRSVILEELLLSADTQTDLETLQIQLRDHLLPLTALADPQIAPSLGVVLIDDRLFWLREPVVGTSYRRWLAQVMQQGDWFEETAVWDYLVGVLAVLARLHQAGLSHGAIDLDSVICRDRDGVILLQRGGNIREFGQIHQLTTVQPNPNPVWLSPQTAQDWISQDLRDLGWSALVLLTGDATIAEPKAALRDLHRDGAIHPDLHKFLSRLLIPQSWQRLRDATAALQAIPASQRLAAPPGETVPPTVAPSPQVPKSPSKQHRSRRRSLDPAMLGLSLVFFILLGILGYRLFRGRSILSILRPPTQATSVEVGKFSGKPGGSTPNLNAISAAETNAPANAAAIATDDQSAIQGIPQALYDQLKTELKPTIKQPESLIDKQLQNLSETARQEIGTYRRKNYDRWFASLSDRQVSQPTVDILADTALYLHFPSLQDKPLNPRSFGQIWYAIARDRITALEQQKQLKIVTPKTFQESGQLQQGNGQVFQVAIAPGEQLQINLQADREDLRLSVIENEIVRTRDSLNTRWTAPKATQATMYEIILTPQKLETVNYQLKLRRN